MKIYENDGKEFYWKLQCKVNQNEQIQKYVDETFLKLFSNHRKKITIRNSFYYVFTHIFIMCEYMNHDKNLQKFVFKYQYNYDLIKKTGLMLNFNRSHKVKFDYQYGEATVKHSSLISLFDELEKKSNLCKITKGYSCPNKGYNKQIQLGFVLFNWENLYNNFYVPNRQTICVDDLVTEEHNYIVVRQKNEIGINIDVTDEYDLSLFQNDIGYIKDITYMYQNMKIDLNFDNFNSVQIDRFLNEYYAKRYKAESRDESCIYSLDFKNEVNYWCNRLKKINPYRVYHKHYDGLTWGRLYGIIDNLPKIYKPFITINGKNTVGIDVKSSVIQFFVLKNFNNVTNLQDFYFYENLSGILNRENIKFLTQTLVYNDTLSKALSAYNGHYYNQRQYSNVMKKEEFTLIYNSMIQERPYLHGLFLHKDVAKECILEESNYMINVSKELLYKKINHIYNFDCYYVDICNLKSTLDIFYNVSRCKYGTKINVDYDVELYNSFL